MPDGQRQGHLTTASIERETCCLGGPKRRTKVLTPGNWRILGPAASETMGTYSACFWISSVRRHRVRDKRGPPKIGHAYNTRDGLDYYDDHSESAAFCADTDGICD